MPDPTPEVYPGSAGEHWLQHQYGTPSQAERFYRDQVLDVITPTMAAYLGRQTMMVLASVDDEGRPDASVRFGEPGFVGVLDERCLTWPELRGNGVHTTLGNLLDNPAVHLMFLDGADRIGLHVRGDAEIVERDRMAKRHPDVVAAPTPGRPPERWVIVRVRNSYVHCRKHFPTRDGDEPIDWGTDDAAKKGGDYFDAKNIPSPWNRRPG